jgi:hypothetical protein
MTHSVTSQPVTWHIFSLEKWKCWAISGRKGSRKIVFIFLVNQKNICNHCGFHTFNTSEALFTSVSRSCRFFRTKQSAWKQFLPLYFSLRSHPSKLRLPLRRNRFSPYRDQSSVRVSVEKSYSAISATRAKRAVNQCLNNNEFLYKRKEGEKWKCDKFWWRFLV